MLADFMQSFMPVMLIFITVTMVVLRAGASRIFFDVVGSFQATRLIGDAQAKITVLQGLMLDGISGIAEGVGLLGSQMQQAIDATVPLAQEIGYARIEFEKFANFAESQQIEERIIEIGEAYAFSADQALAAGAKMAQLSSIVGAGSVPVATEVGIQFGLIGGMETEDAMKKLINLQQQTTFMYGDFTKAQFDALSAQEQANLVGYESVKMLNQLNTIENRSSATMAQITHVMNQFASSARLAGDDVAYMAAMSATLIEAGEEQGKAGRALKMMYARLGADTGNNSEILRKYGIETKDATGNLRSMKDIMSDITDIYPQLEEKHRMEIAQAIAGNDHYVRALKLMDNYTRSVELETMAIGELDTAQDELNKRFKENAFLLTQSEARLKNSKAAVGDLFTPAVIKANNAQAALNESLYEFVKSGSAGGMVLGAFLDGAAQLQQIGQIYAPYVEANLNLMSLNVSLKTQLQIQRALNNEELVRASAYGRQGAMVRANMQALQNQAATEDRRSLILASQLNMSKQDRDLQLQVERLKTQSLTNKRTELIQEQQILQTQIGKLNNLKTESNLMEILDAKAYAKLDADKKTIQLQIQQNQQKQQSLEYLSQEQIYTNALTEKEIARGLTAERVMNYKENHYIHARAQKLMEENILDIQQQQFALMFQQVELHEQLGGIKRVFTKIDEKELQGKQTKLKLTQAQLAEEGQLLLASMANEQAIMGETEAHVILRNAHMGVIEVVGSKMSLEAQNNAIMKQAEQAAKELAVAYGLDEAMLRKLIPQMKIFTQALGQVQAQNDATVASSMMMNNALMGMTTVLGGASMAITMFTDDEKAMRTAMILMNLSMIPMTIQMVTMTKATYGLATATNTAAVGTSRLAVAWAGLNGVMKLSIIGLAAAALSYLIYTVLPDAKEETYDFATSLDSLGITATYTAQQYRDLSLAVAEYNSLQMEALQMDKSAMLAEYESAYKVANDPSLKAFYKTKIEALRQELGILDDIEQKRAATALLEGGGIITSEMIFSDIKTAIDLNEQADAIEKDGERIGKQVDDTILKMYQLFDPSVTKDGKGTSAQEAAKLRQQANFLFSAIPEEYKGAVMDMAKEAKDMPDFLAKLEEYVKDVDFGAIGGDFGGAINDNFVAPIEAAKNAVFEFNNAREEMFFGMAKGNLTGDMVKQVVNKGVETLINTTEVIMTNNFTGMTTVSAANEITKLVMEQLAAQGLNVQAS